MSFTMPFIPGTRYLFTPRKGEIFGASMGTSQSDYRRRLTYLRDEMGACRSTGERTIFHIFRWPAGALESFTDEQAGDYVITKK